MTQVADVPAQAADSASREAAQWLRANWITVAATALIAAQLWLKGVVLAHAFFRQDDWYFFDRALDTHLSWRYLLTVYNGHLMPGGILYSWVLAKASLYDWTLTSTGTLVILAISSLALLRLLRTLFGNRPAILVPMILYLFSPIMLPGLSFWSTTLQWLPTQLVIVMALNAHVSYVRTGRYWHAGVAVAWIFAGLLFDDVVALVPLLLLGITSAFFGSGRWLPATGKLLARYWRVWVIYGVLTIGYVGLFLYAILSQGLSTNTELAKPGSFTNVLQFASSMTRIGLIPAAFGGPWRWLSIGNLAFAAEAPALDYLAWIAAAIVIVLSLWYRRRALRAWVILAGWVLASAIVPLVIGRVAFGSATILGGDLHYLADSLPVLVICVGLVFLPVRDEQSVYRGRPAVSLRVLGTATALIVFVAGSLWSSYSYRTDTSSAQTRSYLATARAALAGAPRGAVIVDSVIPAAIENAYYYGRYGHTSKLIGPLASPARHLTWTTSPSGVFIHLLMFDQNGRLATVGIVGRASSPPPAKRGCWKVAGRPVRLQIPGFTALYEWPWTLELSYRGPSAMLAVQFGGRSHQVTLPAGHHNVYVRALGSGKAILAQVISGGPSVCISQFVIGSPAPSYVSFPIPPEPVRG